MDKLKKMNEWLEKYYNLLITLFLFVKHLKDISKKIYVIKKANKDKDKIK